MSDVPRRRPGRPPLDPNERSVPVHLRLPPRQYDRLADVARRRHVTVQDIVRAHVRRYLAQHRPPT